jgi:uncharacterized protein YeeX (DUF496 family)
VAYVWIGLGEAHYFLSHDWIEQPTHSTITTTVLINKMNIDYDERHDDWIERNFSESTTLNQVRWANAVTMAINRLRNLSNNQHRNRHVFHTQELFSNDNRRVTVKSKEAQVFEIFPWFLLLRSDPNHRYRESLATKNGENIETVSEAVNYFWNETFEEADYSALRAYYQNGPPPRAIWSIVQLKSYLEKDRLIRQTATLKSKNRELSDRLFALEEQMRVLLLLSQNPSASLTAIAATDCSPTSSKRKADQSQETESPESQRMKFDTPETTDVSSCQESESESSESDGSIHSELPTEYLYDSSLDDDYWPGCW